MTKKDFISPFVENLKKIKEKSKADLSRLRRSAKDPSNDTRIFDILSKLHWGIPDWAKRRLDLCAVLYATCYQCEESKNKSFNLGKILYECELKDIRMRALLDTDSENLNFRLRQIFKFINSKRKPLNWEVIIDNILGWDNDKKYVQRKWAEGYFAPELENNELKEKEYVN